MDIGYILLNSIIYGCSALILSVFFSYGKILNFSFGSTLMMSGYILFFILKKWLNFTNLFMFLILLLSFFWINYLLFFCFNNDKQRELAWLIITLAVSLFLENLTNYIYGTTWISLHIQTFSLWMLLIIFTILLVMCFFFFKKTLWGKIFQAISENGILISAFWIKRFKIIQFFFIFLFFLLIGMSGLLLYHSSIKMQDGLFFIIKGMGIMIFVGLEKKEYLFLGALLYVLLEYFLFINIGIPIIYKESLILIFIVFILLFKPEGLFSFKKRSI